MFGKSSQALQSCATTQTLQSLLFPPPLVSVFQTNAPGHRGTRYCTCCQLQKQSAANRKPPPRAHPSNPKHRQHSSRPQPTHAPPLPPFCRIPQIRWARGILSSFCHDWISWESSVRLLLVPPSPRRCPYSKWTMEDAVALRAVPRGAVGGGA
jgi:hypothetical protein